LLSAPDMAFFPAVMAAPVQAVLVDLGNTLFGIEHGGAWSALRGKTPLSIETLRARLHADGDLIDFQRGRLGWRAYYEGLAARLAFRGDPGELADLWDAIFVPWDRRLRAVGELAASLPVVPFSNTNERHAAALERLRPEFFDVCRARCYSFEHGWMKPREEFFEIAAKTAEAPRESCLFIDDSPGHIEAARQFGMATLHLKPSDASDLGKTLRRIVDASID